MKVMKKYLLIIIILGIGLLGCGQTPIKPKVTDAPEEIEYEIEFPWGEEIEGIASRLIPAKRLISEEKKYFLGGPIEVYLEIKNNKKYPVKVLNNKHDGKIKNAFILDFDLDYFPTRESLKPNKKKIITHLILDAQFITIAREKKCFVENCKENNFSVLEAENLLLKLIESVCSK